MIGNRNIVIKREGNRLLLPTIERKEVDAPSNTPIKAFLMCRIVSYDQQSGTLSLKVWSDVVGDPQYQIAIAENSNLLSSLLVKHVVFVDFRFSPPVQNVRLNNTDPDKDDAINKEWMRRRELMEARYEQEKQKERAQEKETAREKEKAQEKETATIVIELPVKELKFSEGKVSFECYITQVDRKVSFDIYHSFLKNEHDSIKNYFPKVLNINKFSIAIQFDYLDRKILNYVCNSPHISMIDHSLFERVEDLYVTDFIINSTQEEIISLNEIAVESSRITGSEKMKDTDWLLNKLIAKERTKHYYHLRYLSDKNVSNSFHLRLTGKPLSFIFLLTMPNGYSLVWETYSTEEATYVWKLTNRTATQLNSEIEELVERIKWLRKNKKMAYVREKPENFIRIEHDYSGEDLGFKKWRTQLEKFILGGST